MQTDKKDEACDTKVIDIEISDQCRLDASILSVRICGPSGKPEFLFYQRCLNPEILSNKIRDAIKRVADEHRQEELNYCR